MKPKRGAVKGGVHQCQKQPSKLLSQIKKARKPKFYVPQLTVSLYQLHKKARLRGLRKQNKNSGIVLYSIFIQQQTLPLQPTGNVFSMVGENQISTGTLEASQSLHNHTFFVNPAVEGSGFNH